MRSIIVLLAIFGTVASDVLIRPPQSDPNIQNEYDGREKKPLAEIAALPKPDDDVNGLFDTPCDMNAIISASGSTLTDLVTKASWRCINSVFGLQGDKARNLCNEADMTTVANAYYQATYSYDPNKPANSPGILNYVLYMRGCYYIQANDDKIFGNYSSNLLSLIRYGLDNFFKRPNLDAKNVDHYEITKESITLISNAHDFFNYIQRLAMFFSTITYSWTFDSDGQSTVVDSILNIFSRSHYLKEEAKVFYCQHVEAPWSINGFLDKHGSMVTSKNEWIIRNSAGELAKFLAYDCQRSTVSGYVRNQLSKYGPNNGDKVWAAMAIRIEEFDNKNCAQYNACNFKADLERKVLPITHSCGKTYKDTFIVRAQSISSSELDEVCRRLKAQESHFHTLVNDNWTPVVPDTNDKIEVVIFNNTDEYKFYAWLLFGIDTNNGGMYMEGDPSQPGNVARYYCYEKFQKGKFDVWNLEHEFSHYLDGRYNMKGNFGDTNKPMTVWWGEGFAEYAANKEQYPQMVDDCKEKLYPLSTIFNNDYSSGVNRIYHYGYLAARFMFERHRSDVNTILKFFRAGQIREYQSWFNGVYNRYDSEFSNWCTCIANGKPCP